MVAKMFILFVEYTFLGLTEYLLTMFLSRNTVHPKLSKTTIQYYLLDATITTASSACHNNITDLVVANTQFSLLFDFKYQKPSRVRFLFRAIISINHCGLKQ